MTRLDLEPELTTPMRAFVTGGSGFVGRNLLPRLRARGHAVRALARTESAARAVAAAGAEPVRGALEELPSLVEGMRGCDVVFHAAASTAEWARYDELYQANVVGTEQVLAAARAARIRRVVHVSTEAVLLDRRPLLDADERWPAPRRPIGGYPATKALAERLALSANGAELEVVVVRPRLVWGRGDTTILPKVVQAVRDGRFRWIDGGRALTSTCHVANACEGLLLAAERARPGEVFFLTDGPPVEVRAFLTALLATQGVDPGSRSLPGWLAYAAAAATEGAWRLLGLRRAPPVQRTAVLLIGRQMTVSDAKARRELGYTAARSRAEGLAEMAADRAG